MIMIKLILPMNLLKKKIMKWLRMKNKKPKWGFCENNSLIFLRFFPTRETVEQFAKLQFLNDNS